MPRNILTGIFVDSALQNGQEEKRRFLLQEVGELFLEADKVTTEQTFRKFRKFRVPSSVGPSPGSLLIESNRDMYDFSFSITSLKSLSLVQSCKVTWLQEQMTWLDFQAQLENPHLQQLFAALDVDETGLALGHWA